MVRPYNHVDATEQRLIQNMVKAKIPWDKIQEVTGRSSSTITRIAYPSNQPKKAIGAPRKVDAKAFGRLHHAATALLKKADARTEVTVTMVKAKAGVVASDKTVREAFHERGIYFRKLKEKPLLTAADVTDRLTWATKRLRRTREGWSQLPHAIIDNKHFQLFTNAAGRNHAARRSIRGAYQPKGGKPHPYVVKPKATVKYPAKGVQVTAAVIRNRIRMWNYVQGSWNGRAAAAMYKGPLRSALKKAYPLSGPRAKWVILEDNDPAGYKSAAGVAAKKEVGIVVDTLPRRSPDLNVLDYSLWRAINVRMRQQEAGFRKNKVETETQYRKRLRDTAMRLPTAVVRAAVADMHKRVRKVVQAHGNVYNE